MLFDASLAILAIGGPNGKHVPIGAKFSPKLDFQLSQPDPDGALVLIGG